jgi:sugar/nucleoside kinase (ribokinase family)
VNLPPDYLVIGHVTRDLVAGHEYRVGGTATYSALAAHGLGQRVAVLTSADPTWPLFRTYPSIEVVRRPSESTTTFENIYAGGARRQRVRSVASVLTPEDLPAAWQQAAIVHLGPVAQEVSPHLVHCFPGALVGVTPQGWMRRWDGDGMVSPTDWESAETVLRAAAVVVMSLEDVGRDRERLASYVRQSRLLVLTLGPQGAVVFQGGREQRVPAYVAEEADPTGAGDVFATAYLVRFAATRDAIEAARFANCAASFVVEAVGAANMPSMEQVEFRMRGGLLRP